MHIYIYIYILLLLLLLLHVNIYIYIYMYHNVFILELTECTPRRRRSPPGSRPQFRISGVRKCSSNSNNSSNINTSSSSSSSTLSCSQNLAVGVARPEVGRVNIFIIYRSRSLVTNLS